MLSESIINEECQIKMNSYQKYKEYRKLWNSQNKEKLCEYQRNQYIKRVDNDPEYRQLLNERVKQRNEKLKLINALDSIKKPRGRPRTGPIKEKKANRQSSFARIDCYNKIT